MREDIQKLIELLETEGSRAPSPWLNIIYDKILI
jgi:hypothetical protein